MWQECLRNACNFLGVAPVRKKVFLQVSTNVEFATCKFFRGACGKWRVLKPKLRTHYEWMDG